MKLKTSLILLTSLGMPILLFASPALAQFHCEQRTDARNTIVCAPPNGSMLQINAKYVCGPGQCKLKPSSTEAICSASPGGLMDFDSRGRGLCVGGCITATEDLCVTAIPDPS